MFCRILHGGDKFRSFFHTGALCGSLITSLPLLKKSVNCLTVLGGHGSVFLSSVYSQMLYFHRITYEIYHFISSPWLDPLKNFPFNVWNHEINLLTLFPLYFSPQQTWSTVQFFLPYRSAPCCSRLFPPASLRDTFRSGSWKMKPEVFRFDLNWMAGFTVPIAAFFKMLSSMRNL